MANPLTREAGGQPVWAWGAEALGALLVFRWWRNRQAASAAGAALGTTSGPPAVSGYGGGLTGSTGPTSAAPASWASWLSQALAGSTGANLSPTQAYNDFTSWINGGCASSAGASAIGNAINTLGLPPGFGTGLPPIQVCAANSQTGTSSPGTSTITAAKNLVYTALSNATAVRTATAAGQTVYAQIAPTDYVAVISGGHYTAAGNSLLNQAGGYKGTLYVGQ